MRKFYLLLIVIISFLTIFYSCRLDALSQGIVISQVQTRSLVDSSASDELVEIYNNSYVDINITDWCLRYGRAGEGGPYKTLACINRVDALTGGYLFLPARSFLNLVSSNFADKYPDFSFYNKFASGLSDSDRWIAIYDGDGEIIDRVQWGDLSETDIQKTTAEGQLPASLPSANELISRKVISEGELQDTNNNFEDFESSSARLEYKSTLLYEIEDLCLNLPEIQIEVPEGYTVNLEGQCSLVSEIDLCSNLEGDQIIIPDGYEEDEAGQCVLTQEIEVIPDDIKPVDLCKNIDGIQIDLPRGFEVDDSANCVLYDVCLNLDGQQLSLPENFYYEDDFDCAYSLTPLELSEVLPNPEGEDSGSEFIELYNPNEVRASLSNYILYKNGDESRPYYFPDSLYIEPNNFLVLYDSEFNFTLVNTNFSLSLVLIDDSFEDELSYEDAKPGESWALIDGVWQYSNNPTPGGVNQKSTDLGQVLGAENSNDELGSCGVGQYRNPETNRCKNIETETALAVCKTGYERNPETNRCRKIVANSEEYAPCKDGYERNSETNRCRKVIASTTQIPEADYGLDEIEQGTDSSEKVNPIVIWSLIGVGLFVLCYAVWEWRIEFHRLYKRIVVGLKRLFNKV